MRNVWTGQMPPVQKLWPQFLNSVPRGRPIKCKCASYGITITTGKTTYRDNTHGYSYTYLDSQFAADDETDCIEDGQVQAASAGELHRDFRSWYALYRHLLRDVFDLLAPDSAQRQTV